MRGPSILRNLRQLAALPLRRETIYHLAFNRHGADAPTLNRLIAADPGLALAILRLLPRALLSRRIGVPQLARAVRPRALLETARADCDRSELRAAPQPLLDRIWAHSVATAHAARELSRARGYEHAQMAFLAGLLHNVGLLAAAALEPEAIAEILGEPKHSRDGIELEQERLGTSHVKIARQLAKRWGLPQWLHDVAWWHHHRGAPPKTIADRALVELVREADVIVQNSDFSLAREPDTRVWTLPWKSTDAMQLAISRGVRQAWGFLQDHPLRDGTGDASQLTARAIAAACENLALHSDLDWRRDAWDQWAKMPVDATPVEVTALVAETFAHATGALGALCYVRNEDGTFAEGTFWSDTHRSVSCALVVGANSKSHGTQVISQLHATWQNRPHRAIDLNTADENFAHVLLWLDDFAVGPDPSAIESASTLCTAWLATAAQTARLEAQLDGLATALGEQSTEFDARLEAAKLEGLAELAAGAGHEMNNPLAVISGRAQLLLAEESEPRRRKALETIVAQSQRIHRMIVELMTFARPPQPDLKPLPVADVVELVMGNLKEQADRRKITLTACPAAGLPQITGDLNQLAMAVECIVQNSLDAVADETGAVEIAVELGSASLDGSASPAACIRLNVIDNGPGISESQRAHIFEPFYSGRDAGRGLGMGLAKAWRIVQLHGGEIQVSSSGKGTTVSVQLATADSGTASGDRRACA